MRTGIRHVIAFVGAIGVAASGGALHAESTANRHAQAGATDHQGQTPVADLQQPRFMLTWCQEVPSMGDTWTAMNGVDPIGVVEVYLANRSKGKKAENSAESQSSALALLEDVKHGKLVPYKTDTGTVYYMYEPERGYVGKDTAVFIATLKGISYRLLINLDVSTQGNPVGYPNAECPNEVKLTRLAS